MSLPVSVLRLPLPGAALRLYAALERIGGGRRFAWPSTREILDSFPLGSDERTIRRAREELQAAGLLRDDDDGAWWLLMVPDDPADDAPPRQRPDPFRDLEEPAPAAPAAPSPRRRRVPSTSGSLVGFEEFHALYPWKKARAEAERAWVKCGAALDPALRATIMDALRAQIDWRARAAQVNPAKFIPEWPYPASWLNGKRWLDVLEPVEPPPARPAAPYTNGAKVGGAVTPPVVQERAPRPELGPEDDAAAREAIAKAKALVGGVAAARTVPAAAATAGSNGRSLHDRVRELRAAEGKATTE